MWDWDALEVELRKHDPRELLQPRDDDQEVRGFQTCICPSEMKREAEAWVEANPDAYRWIVEALRGAKDADWEDITIRNLLMWLQGKAPREEWMTTPPDGVRFPARIEAWLARKIMWQNPDLYGFTPLQATECWGCSYGRIPKEELEELRGNYWDAIIAMMKEGRGNLYEAQYAVVEPDEGLAHEMMLMADDAKRASNEHARTQRQQCACSLCGEMGFKGKAKRGERAIHTEHGYPKSRYEEFLGRPFKPADDIHDRYRENRYPVCDECNLNKGTQLLSQHMAAANLTRTSISVATEVVDCVLAFEEWATSEKNAREERERKAAEKKRKKTAAV